MIYNHNHSQVSQFQSPNTYLNQSHSGFNTPLEKKSLRGNNSSSSHHTSQEFFQVILNKAVMHFPHLEKTQFDIKGNNFADLSNAIEKIVHMIPEPTNGFEQSNALIRMRNIADEQEKTIQQNMAFVSSRDSMEENIENIKPDHHSFTENSAAVREQISNFKSSANPLETVTHQHLQQPQQQFYHNNRSAASTKAASTSHTTPTHEMNDQLNSFALRKISIEEENRIQHELEDLSSNDNLHNHNTSLEIRMQVGNINNGNNGNIVNNGNNQLPLDSNELRAPNFIRNEEQEYYQFDFYNPDHLHRERDEFNPVYFSQEFDHMNDFPGSLKENQFSVNFLEEHQQVFSSEQENNYDQFLA